MDVLSSLFTAAMEKETFSIPDFVISLVIRTDQGKRTACKYCRYRQRRFHRTIVFCIIYIPCCCILRDVRIGVSALIGRCKEDLRHLPKADHIPLHQNAIL